MEGNYAHAVNMDEHGYLDDRREFEQIANKKATRLVGRVAEYVDLWLSPQFIGHSCIVESRYKRELRRVRWNTQCS